MDFKYEITSLEPSEAFEDILYPCKTWARDAETAAAIVQQRLESGHVEVIVRDFHS